MEIETKSEGEKLTITVSGRVDTVTAPELAASFQFGDATCVVLDLADVQYMSSAGLRLLLIAHKTMLEKGDHSVQLSNASAAMPDVDCMLLRHR